MVGHNLQLHALHEVKTLYLGTSILVGYIWYTDVHGYHQPVHRNGEAICGQLEVYMWCRADRSYLTFIAADTAISVCSRWITVSHVKKQI